MTRLLTVCGSLQTASMNRAALDVAHAWARTLGGSPSTTSIRSGELYAKPVGVLSAGTSGGVYDSQALVQTLTWQGAHVVADLGIAAPRTKSDAEGRLTDDPTIRSIQELTALVIGAPQLTRDARLALVTAIVEAAGVDTGHIAPVV